MALFQDKVEQIEDIESCLNVIKDMANNLDLNISKEVIIIKKKLQLLAAPSKDVMDSYWTLMRECESNADNNDDRVLKHWVEGFFKQYNQISGTNFEPIWVTRAKRITEENSNKKTEINNTNKEKTDSKNPDNSSTPNTFLESASGFITGVGEGIGGIIEALTPD